MKSRPIIFSSPMVRAILSGNKTMTRRLKSNCEPGDELWVKETFAETEYGILYKADFVTDESKIRFKSPLFMPRNLSRITLIVTGISRERLQEITEEDAIKEGATKSTKGNWWSMDWNQEAFYFDAERSPIDAFANFIDKIHKRKIWCENPEVDVITFQVNK